MMFIFKEEANAVTYYLFFLLQNLNPRFCFFLLNLLYCFKELTNSEFNLIDLISIFLLLIFLQFLHVLLTLNVQLLLYLISKEAYLLIYRPFSKDLNLMVEYQNFIF